MEFSAVIIALNAVWQLSGALMGQAEISARQWLCPPIPLCLTLKTLDGIPYFWVVFPTGSRPLLENPTTWGTNTKAEFSIAKGGKQFGVNYLPLLFQGLDGACDLYPSAEKGIRRERCQMRKWVWAFRREGLEQMTQCSWR